MPDGPRRIHTHIDGQRRLPAEGDAGPTHAEATILREVLVAVRRIRHGQVQIHIQDRKVVQIDRTEKVRLQRRCETREGP